MGGAWNGSLSKICFRASEEAYAAFLEDETGVLRELHERLTTQRTNNICMQRTRQEVEEIVALWWKLQGYRRRLLERKRRHDSVAELLSEEAIQAVNRAWE